MATDIATTDTTLVFASQLQTSFNEDLRGPLALLLRCGAAFHRARQCGPPTDPPADRLHAAALDVGRVLAAWRGLAGLDEARTLNDGRDGTVLDLLDLADVAKQFTADGLAPDLEDAVGRIIDRYLSRETST